MRPPVWLLVLGLAVLLSGCLQHSITDVLEALGKDQATVCAKVSGGPYIGELYRTNAQNVRLKCTRDGLEVEALPR